MLADSHLHVRGEVGPRTVLAYMDRAGLDDRLRADLSPA